MNITWVVRILLALIASSFLIIGAQTLARAEWPTNYQHFNDIRSAAQELGKGTHLRFTLNDGTVVYGTMLKYERYTDYIWYQPQNTGHNWFKQDAFEVHELASLEVVAQEPI